MLAKRFNVRGVALIPVTGIEAAVHISEQKMLVMREEEEKKQLIVL